LMKFRPLKTINVIQLAVVLAILFNVGILLYFSAQTSMWDDEVNSYFLSTLPVSEMIDLMSGNFDEDAPGFNILEHGWQKIAHSNQFALRLMPFSLWLATLLGVGFLAYRLGGNPGLYWALIITALWPYHWIYPIALRWYSLAAALGVWNLYFFVKLLDSVSGDVDYSRYRRLLFGALVAVTGAALWYTVYSAPVLAAGELAALIFVSGWSPRKYWAWGLSWLGAVILYLPWLSTFLGQLGESTGTRFAWSNILSSLYVLWAGDFSIPTTFWISLPLLGAFVIVGVLALRYWSVSKIPLVVSVVILLGLLLFGVVEMKRLLIVTVFLSSAVGLAVAAAMREGPGPITRNLLITAGVLALIGFGGSFANMVSGTGWITYRWLDKINEAASYINSEHQDALILTNSNALAFYANDSIGIELAKYQGAIQLGSESKTKVWNTLLRTDPTYQPKMLEAISSSTEIVYAHHAFFTSAGSTGEMESVVRWLESMSFDSFVERQFTPIENGIEQFLDFPDHPGYRMTLIYLKKK